MSLQTGSELSVSLTFIRLVLVFTLGVISVLNHFLEKIFGAFIHFMNPPLLSPNLRTQKMYCERFRGWFECFGLGPGMSAPL